MKAEIKKETDDGFGLLVIDNNNVEHKIGVCYDGEIDGHLQDGYPDEATKRTIDENAHVDQARRRARYHVYQETEYNPFPVESNLPRIKRVKEGIDELSPEEFESYFADAYDQVLSLHPTVKPPVSRPASVPPGNYILYLIDVYLNENDEIEAVSDIHLQYLDKNGSKVQDWNNDPFPDRNADARLQLFSKYIPSIEVFQEFVVYHLRCQIRDVYIGAGLEPPEEYRVLGRGQDKMTGRYYEGASIYDDYHLEEADIPGYELEFDYGFGEFGKQSVINAKRSGLKAASEFSELDQIMANPSRGGEKGLLEAISELLREGADAVDEPEDNDT